MGSGVSPDARPDPITTALLMCGGRGSRLEAAIEKPLYHVDGRPMVDAVLEALRASKLDRVIAAGSPHTPETADHLEGRVEQVTTAGAGYVADLEEAMADIDEPRVLTVAADLPLLTGRVIDRVLVTAGSIPASVTVTVPRGMKRQLGVSVETPGIERIEGAEVVPSGVNVVDRSRENESAIRLDEAALAVNVNRVEDAEIAAGMTP